MYVCMYVEQLFRIRGCMDVNFCKGSANKYLFETKMGVKCS